MGWAAAFRREPDLSRLGAEQSGHWLELDALIPQGAIFPVRSLSEHLGRLRPVAALIGASVGW